MFSDVDWYFIVDFVLRFYNFVLVDCGVGFFDLLICGVLFMVFGVVVVVSVLIDGV